MGTSTTPSSPSPEGSKWWTLTRGARSSLWPAGNRSSSVLPPTPHPSSSRRRRPAARSSRRAAVPELWPPNHKLVPVRIVGITGPDGDPVTMTITGITQDEPLESGGDGATCPDARLRGGLALVRRERSGLGNGRVYRISFRAQDGRGGSCEGHVDVCVPHDRRPGHTCLDDGQTVNSLGECAP